MNRHSILFAIALIAVIAFAGSAQAAVAPTGQVNSTTAEGEIVTFWLDVNPSDYTTVAVFDSGDPYIDYWWISDITPMLDRNGYNSGDTSIPVIVAMYCSGTERDIDGVLGSSYTNADRNVTVLHFTVDYADGGYSTYPRVMELEACPAETHPDLIVESITPNCGGYLFGNESNDISAVIKNIGSADAGASDVSFVLNDGYSEIVSVSSLDAGNSTTVSITDPTIRNAGDTVTITVTADCNAEVSESDETNNTSVRSETIVNNGYKGKTCTGGSNVTTVKTYDLNGSLIYSPGDSYYLSAYYNPGWTTYDVTWTAGDLSVTGTVVEARLYVMYTWDKKDVMSNNVNLTFNGNDQTVDEHYQDEKMFASSYPYGMLVYNVTDDFNAAGNYANLTNSYTYGGNVSMRGMMLVVIYEDDTEPHRQIFVNEGFDLLYGGSSKCTTPDEATAWAPIAGPAINMSEIAGARLVTFAPGADGSGSAGEGELIFNGEVWNDEWTDNEVHQIGVSDRDVTSYLQSTDNLVGFQSNGDYMEASNAFLVVTLGILGDVNGDGHLTTADAAIVLKMAVRGEYSEVADVSGDRAVTSLDALMILQAVVGS